jgi:hypothetical protein
MISVILVWKVKDSFKATFEVDKLEDFIQTQTDSAVRKLAATFPYDHFEDEQASAVVAARNKIVEGAVGMVESALHLLSSKGIIELDEEKKAAMVGNLMVVLCGDRETQPVVNTGTLNH